MFFSVITKNLIWAFTKNQYIGWNCLKREEAWTVCRFKGLRAGRGGGGVVKKSMGVFEGGWIANIYFKNIYIFVMTTGSLMLICSRRNQN